MILPFNKLNIPWNDLVLEVGSGHNPSYRADVLCDKYLTDDERLGPLKTDRPVFLSDCQSLPFKDESFDYIISRQVLEHVKDPLKACEELSRVGKKGYIETPSFFWEKLHSSRKYHRWFILLIDNNLVFYSKDRLERDSVFGCIFDIMYSNSLEYHLFFRSYKNLFEIRFEWNGRINCIVNPSDDHIRSLFLKPWGMNEYKRFYPERSFSKQIMDLTRNLCSTSLLFLLKKPRTVLGNIIKEYRDRNVNVNLNNILACPKCKGNIRLLSDQACCVECNSVYSRKDGILDMNIMSSDTNIVRAT